jgi:N-acylneuraminate cytidylyltransferase
MALSNEKPVAVIPARGGSKRLPRKNIAEAAGRPMIAWPVEAALDSGIFSEVIVSTDDAEIAAISAKAGARVIERPADLATDTAHETLVYRHVLDTLGTEAPDHFCALYPTALLITKDDLRESFVQFETGADVVMAVSEYPIHPYKALKQRDDGFYGMVYPVDCKMRSQTYPHYVASNGTFYWFRTRAFLDSQTYYPDRLAVHILPGTRAVDIDTAADLEIARLFKQHQLAGKTP